MNRRDPLPRVAARGALILAAALALTVVLVAAGLLLYGQSYANKTMRGVSVAGIDLGGLTEAEAAARIDQQITTVAPQQITFVHDGGHWSLPADDLGVRYDAQATAQAAFAYGHSGSLWTDSPHWLAGLLRGKTVPVVTTVNVEPAVAALQSLAPEVTRPPRNAGYVFDQSGKLVIDPGESGIAIDVSGTVQDVRERFGQLSTSPVTISTVTVPAPMQAKDLEPGLKQASGMVSQPLTLTHGAWKWQIPPATLGAMLQIDMNSSGGKPSISLSRDLLQSYVAQLDGQVKTQGVNASVAREGSQFVVKPSTNGEALDTNASVQHILDGLTKDQHQIDLAVTSTPATIVDADAQSALNRAQQLVAKPVKLTWNDGETTVSGDALAAAVRFVEQPKETSKIGVDIDQAALASAVEKVKPQVEKAAKDAKLRYLNGKVTVTEPEQPGRALDVAKSAAALRTAVLQGQTSAALVTNDVAPKVTAAAAAGVTIKERLSSGETYYAGSIANRKFNVELAVSRVNGALIAPGATFSFDDTVGGIDLEHGFKVGYGIVGASNGSVSTVPSVGGGVCQVSTTLYHAAFWAGMPIVDRNWHLYWIPTYGQAPSGLTGLDATVDTDSGLDFQFKNATDNWLAIVATANGTAVRFELWGTDPGWKVDVDKPVISNRVAADTKMVYENSDQMPAGQTLLVEHAEDGFDVAIHRRVTKGDAVIDDATLKSHYVPSQNVTLVGTAR
jgi:vancomycin resistance protein YoaR